MLGKKNGPGAWIQYIAARCLLGGASRMPRGLQSVLVGGLARIARSVDKRHSNAARAYMRQALGCAAAEGLIGPDIEARVLTAWRHFLQLSLDSAAFDRVVGQDPLAHVEVERCEGLDELIASGRGGLLVSPHLGDWEAGSAFLSFQVGQNVLLNLPEFYFGRLVQEYGRRSFVEARGEAASIVNAVELILTCLRSEEGFCTSVPPASSAPLL